MTGKVSLKDLSSKLMYKNCNSMKSECMFWLFHIWAKDILAYCTFGPETFGSKTFLVKDISAIDVSAIEILARDVSAKVTFWPNVL